MVGSGGGGGEGGGWAEEEKGRATCANQNLGLAGGANEKAEAFM